MNDLKPPQQTSCLFFSPEQENPVCSSAGTNLSGHHLRGWPMGRAAHRHRLPVKLCTRPTMTCGLQEKDCMWAIILYKTILQYNMWDEHQEHIWWANDSFQSRSPGTGLHWPFEKRTHLLISNAWLKAKSYIAFLVRFKNKIKRLFCPKMKVNFLF